MNLSKLETCKGQVNVVLLQTPCDRLEIFVRDRIKRMFECTQESIFDITSKKEIKEAKNLCYTQPFYCKKWMFVVDLDKLGSDTKELVKVIKESHTSVYFCTSSKYFTYKNFKNACKGVDYFYDFYITSLRGADFAYLYNAFVPSENRLTKQLYDYVQQAYSFDVTALFDLFVELAGGAKIENRKDIADICGIGGNSVETFVLSLLKEPPNTQRGLLTVIKNRIKAGSELADTLNWGTLWTYSNNCIKSLLDLKMLCISGTIYKNVYNLPNGYDEKRLSKYQRYLWRIKEIPLSRLIRFKAIIGDTRWESSSDFLRFIYNYYSDVVRKEHIDEKINIKKVKKID